MVDVFITIDTEVWPFSRHWPDIPLTSEKSLAAETSNYLYGTTSSGDYGLKFQLQRLKTHGLKATFFVEALSADVLGRDQLRKAIDLIEHESQEVQLQIHTEWLGELAHPSLPDRHQQFLHYFSFEQQRSIITHGLEILRESGAGNVVALRAGNFGADSMTLRAAGASGLLFDSSYNLAYLGAACQLSALGPLLRPKRIEGVTEIPVSYFYDYARHIRNAQLCACSFAEMSDALLWAWQDKWKSFCIVLHSFELLKNYNRRGSHTRPHPLHIARFESLCSFLASNRDKFRTVHFREYKETIDADLAPRPMPSNIFRTMHRYGEQLLGQSVGAAR